MNTLLRLRSVVFLAGLTLASLQPASAATFLMNEYNLITLNNLIEVGEVEGKTFVGGNYNVDTTSQFGFKYGVGVNTDNALQVAGEVNRSVQINVTGGMEVDTDQTVTGAFPNYSVKNSGSTQTATVSLNGGGGTALVQNSGLDALAASIVSELQGNSTDFSALSDTAGATIDLSDGNAGKFNTGSISSGTVVFSVSATDMFTANRNLQLLGDHLADLDAIIINVTGGSGVNLAMAGGQGFSAGFVDQAIRQKVLWNFFEADQIIDTSVTAFQGSLLAPLARLNAGSQNVDGSIAVYRFDSTGEVHLANLSAASNEALNFGNTLVTAPASATPIPEPSPLSLMILGCLLLAIGSTPRSQIRSLRSRLTIQVRSTLTQLRAFSRMALLAKMPTTKQLA